MKLKSSQQEILVDFCRPHKPSFLGDARTQNFIKTRLVITLEFLIFLINIITPNPTHGATQSRPFNSVLHPKNNFPLLGMF